MAGKKDKVKDSERFSIIVPTLDRCMICGSSDRVTLHEVVYGIANRKKSKEWGLVVPLCYEHHEGSNGVHYNPNFDLMLKKQAEKIWISKYSTKEKGIDDFLEVFRINYLDEEEV